MPTTAINRIRVASDDRIERRPETLYALVARESVASRIETFAELTGILAAYLRFLHLCAPGRETALAGGLVVAVNQTS